MGESINVSIVRRCRARADAATALPASAGASPPAVARRSRGLVSQARGLFAEERVCHALEAEGWTVLLRRARTACGEIDIVAELPQAAPGLALIAFIEVKSRPTFAAAAQALTARQRQRLLGAAEVLLQRYPQWSDSPLRFDLVLLDGTGRLRRIADAFRIGDPP